MKRLSSSMNESNEAEDRRPFDRILDTLGVVVWVLAAIVWLIVIGFAYYGWTHR